jgi:hypothetical protein
MCASTRLATIGQECDPRVALTSDPRPGCANESDLVLLADARIGQQGGC